MKKPCPDLVKQAGAELLLAVRLGERFAAQVDKAMAAVNATRPELLCLAGIGLAPGGGHRLGLGRSGGRRSPALAPAVARRVPPARSS